MKTVALLLLLVGSLSAETQYFPRRVFCTFKSEPGECERWYVKHLVAMKEPSLWDRSKDSSLPVYRFLWLRTFHHPISARLELNNDRSAQLFVTVLSGSGGYEPGDIAEQHEVKVSPESVAEFERLLAKFDFWNVPTELQRADSIGCDGAQWILEGVREGRYHVVDRWSPGRGAYQRVALFLVVKLGGLHFGKGEIY